MDPRFSRGRPANERVKWTQYERLEPLGAYLARRFSLMLLTLFGISVIIFVMLRVMPGNIVDILYDAAGYVNPREKAKIEAD